MSPWLPTTRAHALAGNDTATGHRGTLAIAALGLLAVAAVACSAPAGSPPSVAAPTTTPAPTSTTSTTATPGTTVAKPTTTTTAFAPTTTTPPAATGTFTTPEGWQYSYAVTFEGPSLKRSPGQCIAAPPPGKVNLRFTLQVHNDAPDREAPMPDVRVATNVSTSGVLLNPAPTSLDDVVGGMPDQMAVVELDDDGDGACDGLRRGYWTSDISAGRSKTYRGTVAAVPESIPPDVALVFLATPTQSGPPGTAAASRSAGWVVRYGP